MRISTKSATIFIFLLTIGQTKAIDLGELKSYTLVTDTRVDGEFEGADFDKVVDLENGMMFQFNEYNYSYSYRPQVSVFARTLSVLQQKALGVKNPKLPITLYKLLINDNIYNVFRLR